MGGVRVGDCRVHIVFYFLFKGFCSFALVLLSCWL